MNWDQIEDNWVAMTRRMRPSTKSDDAAPAALDDRAGILAREPTQTVTESLKPSGREVV
ncbi:hypothetical protein GCM10011316_29820 [Roseibium aquae]|uniref:Uncharacterized protein n=1 Tax=Roseibium aquae TaxID=1323746 RepID=A0A916X2S2_9HYPH|nr:hypothetical protein [Roseibium aquae]GGB55762.1 hypothetical protein GCM10011316_29820 [Roseibium aquae]